MRIFTEEQLLALISAATYRHHRAAYHLRLTENRPDPMPEFFLGMATGFRRIGEVFGTDPDHMNQAEHLARELYVASVTRPDLDTDVTRLAQQLPERPATTPPPTGENTLTLTADPDADGLLTPEDGHTPELQTLALCTAACYRYLHSLVHPPAPPASAADYLAAFTHYFNDARLMRASLPATACIGAAARRLILDVQSCAVDAPTHWIAELARKL